MSISFGFKKIYETILSKSAMVLFRFCFVLLKGLFHFELMVSHFLPLLDMSLNQYCCCWHQLKISFLFISFSKIDIFYLRLLYNFELIKWSSKTMKTLWLYCMMFLVGLFSKITVKVSSTFLFSLVLIIYLLTLF